MKTSTKLLIAAPMMPFTTPTLWRCALALQGVPWSQDRAEFFLGCSAVAALVCVMGGLIMRSEGQ